MLVWFTDMTESIETIPDWGVSLMESPKDGVYSCVHTRLEQLVLSFGYMIIH